MEAASTPFASTVSASGLVRALRPQPRLTQSRLRAISSAVSVCLDNLLPGRTRRLVAQAAARRPAQI